MKNRIAGIIGLAFVLSGFAAAACSSGEALSVDEYFQRTEDALDKFESSFDELDGPDVGNVETEEQAVEAMRQVVVIARNQLRDAFVELREITPPDDFRQAHEDFFNELENLFLPIFDRLAEAIEDADSFNEVIEVMFEFGDDFDNIQPSQKLIDACNSLQTSARAAGSNIDLGCNDFS